MKKATCATASCSQSPIIVEINGVLQPHPNWTDETWRQHKSMKHCRYAARDAIQMLEEVQNLPAGDSLRLTVEKHIRISELREIEKLADANAKAHWASQMGL